MTTAEPKWTQLDTAEQVAEAACQQILKLAELAIQQRGIFRIVLAGGSTPQMSYELLSQQAADWSKWAFYFGDERCLPQGHADLNYVMAKQSLLDRVPVNSGQVYPIHSQHSAEQGAEQYIDCIQKAVPFDITLLGMGEDGHTASIFPGHNWQNKPVVYAVHDAPKPPGDRITLSIEALGNTRKLLVLITGENKANAVSKWQQGSSLPVNSIQPRADSEILIDQNASAGLRD